MGEFRRQRVDPKGLPDILRAKWADDGGEPTILREGFVPLPKRLLRCMHSLFTGHDAMEELAVVLAVVDYRRPRLSRPPSLEYLAYLAGLAPERFAELLDGLAAKGLVELETEDEGINVGINGLLRAIESATPG
jgi:hypothetical protein